ncbi:FadR/GntR family transcriptional regulator [Salinicola avicenniae]|uniref:FadR/GntR family transcriptional regulator n=1 Tax=Salinicola avicenniae TaxID=2916836 RepID=UPI002072F3FF|nr:MULTISPECIES: FCD domain-containing protein [unclassified Salinicola]
MKAVALQHELGGRIARGEFASGLPGENALAQQFCVSRTTVRAALQALVARGLVEIRPASGAVIRETASWDWLDEDVWAWACQGDSERELQREGFEVRLLIEPAIAAHAASRASLRDLGELENALETMEAHRHDAEVFNQADIEFHRTLARASGNRVMSRMGSVLESVQRTFFENSYRRDDTEIEMTLALHRDLLEAVRLRRIEDARRLARTLVETCDKRLNEAQSQT